MRFPMFLTVAWLSPSARRLLSTARQITIDSGDDCIEGVHLFLGAASMPASKAGRSVPRPARLILQDYRPVCEGEVNNQGPRFIPIGEAIKESCRVLAEQGHMVLPEHLLREVLKRDPATQADLVGLLGNELFTDVKTRMFLRGFNQRERTGLIQIKDQIEVTDNV